MGKHSYEVPEGADRERYEMLVDLIRDVYVDADPAAVPATLDGEPVTIIMAVTSPPGEDPTASAKQAVGSPIAVLLTEGMAARLEPAGDDYFDRRLTPEEAEAYVERKLAEQNEHHNTEDFVREVLKTNGMVKG